MRTRSFGLGKYLQEEEETHRYSWRIRVFTTFACFKATTAAGGIRDFKLLIKDIIL